MADSNSIELPSRMAGHTPMRVIKELLDQCPNKKLPQNVTIDFSKLNFIDPCGITFLYNFTSWLTHFETKVFYSNYYRDGDAIKYLDDSLFFEKVLGRKIFQTSCPRRTTRPLQQIANSQIHGWLGSNLMPWISERTGIEDSNLGSIRVCISEIFNNIQDHTRHDIGSIFVQHYPNKNTIDISIADFGPGVPATVQRVLPYLTDADAIIKAAENGFTTKSQPRNQGIGLNYLIDTIAGNGVGSVTIYSLTGIIRFEKSDMVGERYRAFQFGIGFCPGTTFHIEIDTEKVKRLGLEQDGEEDFAWS